MNPPSYDTIIAAWQAAVVPLGLLVALSFAVALLELLTKYRRRR